MTEPRRTDGGVTIAQYPKYEECVYDGLDAAMDLVGPDYHYGANCSVLSEDGIESATKAELNTWITRMVRMERFGYGHIAGAVSSGVRKCLLNMMEVVLPAEYGNRKIATTKS